MARGETVQQKARLQESGQDTLLVLRRDHARTVRVGDEDVVELRQEARWSGRVGIREWSIEDVQQLGSVLRPEASQTRAETCDRLAQTGESRPTTDVRARCRTERGEVTKDDVVR